LLSILVPAYAYAAGVTRILAGLAPWAADCCEVLVFDDSPGDEVAAAVHEFCASSACVVDYRHHRPALGAVPNWNALLDSARGSYVWLLHHDEFPVGANFLSRLLAALQTDPDVLLLSCLLVDADSGRNRRHMPATLQLAVARHNAGYLFRRNVIGPVSSLVMRRSLCPRFEPALKWKVDVAFYVQLLQRSGVRIESAGALSIGSVLNREGSITATLQKGLAQRQRDEHRWLRECGSARTIWLADPGAGPWASRLLLATERAAWMLWRGVSRMPAWMGRSARPTAELRCALHPQPTPGRAP
jgi:hypothetical protein